MTQEALPIAAPPPKVINVTETAVLGLLKAKHTRNGNGGSGEFAFFTQVRDAGGFDASVSIDAVALSLWPSRGYEIEGFEVKVSRSDWRRELAQPHKAEAACKVVDRFTVVAPRGVVLDGELPELWGLIEVVEGRVDGLVVPKLRTAKAAPLLEPGRTRRRVVKRDFLVGLIRSCPGAIPGGKLDLEAKALAAVREEGRRAGLTARESEVAQWKVRAEAAEGVIRAFEVESGVPLTRWGHSGRGEDVDPKHVAEVGRALRSVLKGVDEVEEVRKSMRLWAARFRDAAGRLDDMVGASAKDLDGEAPAQLR